MTDNEKLIDDALTAFADREIPAPSRDDLRVALDAFEASLTLCGCEACATARRERTGLTDHDRTSLARVLHQIVYSPGANFDRAVPGIQEYMIACADKVAAAVPWLVPQPTRPEAHTPTDDERANRSRLITIINEIQSQDPFAIADAVLAAGFGFRRSEVLAQSAHQCETCQTCGVHEGRHHKCCGCYDGVCCQGPQTSDARVYDAETAFWAHKERTGVFRGAMRAALRAAAVVGQEGEQR